MERDVIIGTCEWAELFGSMIPLLNGVLDAALGTPGNAVSEQELVDLLVSNIMTFLTTAAHLIGTQLEGIFASPDDMVGLAMQIHLPTQGAFTDLLNFGLALAGINNGEIPIEELTGTEVPSNMKVRIGHLLPSHAYFDFDVPGGAHYLLKTIVGS
jgi:hypothetical protein